MKMHASLVVPGGLARPTAVDGSVSGLVAAALDAASRGQPAALVIVWHTTDEAARFAKDGAASMLEMGMDPFQDHAAGEPLRGH